MQNLRYPIFFTCLAGLCFALVSQHMFGMSPCPLCIVQRYVLICTAIAALSDNIIKRLIFPFVGVAVGIYHSMIALGGISSCDPKIENMIEEIPLSELVPWMFAPSGNCSDQWNIFGIPYPVAGTLFFVAIILATAIPRRFTKKASF